MLYATNTPIKVQDPTWCQINFPTSGPVIKALMCIILCCLAELSRDFITQHPQSQ